MACKVFATAARPQVLTVRSCTVFHAFLLYDMPARLQEIVCRFGCPTLTVPSAIALTGYARVEDRMRALEAGYQLFVPKPVEASELASVLSNLDTHPGNQGSA